MEFNFCVRYVFVHKMLILRNDVRHVTVDCATDLAACFVRVMCVRVMCVRVMWVRVQRTALST